MAINNGNSVERRYAHIVGWGMALPETVLTNDDLAAIVETSDEWIRERTGIKTRYIANERETTATLGFKAAQRALEVADILPDALDLIIVATSTPDNIFPSTASIIQNMLGAGFSGAFDLSAACSGFVYAVDMAAQAIKSGSIENAMVIGAETMSRVLDWQDRSTCILFGDGAGAVVLSARDTPGGVLSSVLRSDGAGQDLLGIPAFGSLDRALAGITPEGHRLHKMHMAGGEVFKFATKVIGESIREAAQLAKIDISQLKVIVPHQANDRIITAAARNLEIERERFVTNIDRYGNTSAASIPMALVEAVEQNRLQPGDHLAFIGFGGGLAWAAMIIQWSDIAEQKRFGAQRRQAIYARSAARTWIQQITRRYSEMFSRIRPDYGRLRRLRRRIDEHGEELK
jgi:3-oxoacyl-[acyl-carrier-protein] synthase-3